MDNYFHSILCFYLVCMDIYLYCGYLDSEFHGMY